MKKPDPTRVMGKGYKPDKLKMKSFGDVDLGSLEPPSKGKSSSPTSPVDKAAAYKKKKQPSKQPRNRDAMKPRNHDTTVSRYHDTIINLVRKAVKELGKEAATHRFTIEEKKAIADIIYSYRNRDVRTSENEITRIAINFILTDYRENGENSVLDKTIKALNK